MKMRGRTKRKKSITTYIHIYLNTYMPEQFVNKRTYHKPLFTCKLFLVSPVTAITGEKTMVNIYFCSAHNTVLLAFFGLWHKA